MASKKHSLDMQLGQEYENLDERKEFLANNADGIEEMTYTKSFDSDTLMRKKDKYVVAAARVHDIEEEVKNFRELKKAELKPYKEECATLLSEIKQKGSLVTEKVFKFVDREARMTGFYNADGNLIASRPATRDELPQNIYSINREREAM